jgi:hypothetical protein
VAPVRFVLASLSPENVIVTIFWAARKARCSEICVDEIVRIFLNDFSDCIGF